MKREELNSKKQVDAATTTKLNAEAAYVEAKAVRERQQARFERMNQKKN